jgi:hypothetical protein
MKTGGKNSSEHFCLDLTVYFPEAIAIFASQFDNHLHRAYQYQSFQSYPSFCTLLNNSGVWNALL